MRQRIGTGYYGAGVPDVRLRVEVNMRSPDFGATAQASVCGLEPLKAGRTPDHMVTCPNKPIVGLSVGGVLDTGWLGCGHARPVHFINNEVGRALLWRLWRL